MLLKVSTIVNKIGVRNSINRIWVTTAKGSQGKSATVSVGTTSTLPAGSNATVANSGTSTDAVLNFGIPKGDKGDQGDPATNIVQSVNTQIGDVVLDANDVGADVAGSAATALANAKTYIDQEVSSLDGELAVVAKTGSYNDLLGKPTIPNITGKADKTYVDSQDTSVASTAQSNLTAHTSNTSNPHSVTKAQVGLGSVSNLAPADMPVSTAQAAAIASKADQATTYTKAEVNALDAAHVAATDPHPQYINDARGDARYADQPYAVMAKAKFASLSSSYGMLGKIFGNSGYLNDLQVYGESTQASIPTPDVPVPIVSTAGNVTVQSVAGAGNLFNKADSIVTGKYFNPDGTMGDLGSAFIQTTYIPVAPSTSYTMSYFVAGDMRPVQYDANKNFIVRSNNSAQVHTFTTASNAAFVRISGITSQIDNTQFERGSATPYKAFVGTTQTLPLGTTQLRSLPNGVSDRIYKSGSSWFLEQNVGSITLTGTESFGVSASSGSPAYTYAFTADYDAVLPAIADLTKFANNRFDKANSMTAATTFTADTMSAGNPSTQKLRVMILTSRLTTVNQAGIRAWFLANPTTINFETQTPTTTQITDPTLITALENIRTYQGITNITASTPVSGSYGLDLTTALASKANTSAVLSKTGDTATGKMTFDGGIAIADKQNIELSATTGTRIGTSTTQKLGFYNATPVVRPTATPANATNLATAIALANDLKAKLIALGLIS